MDSTEHETPRASAEAAGAPRVLGNGQRAAALAVGFGMALAGLYGLVISYLTVLDLATAQGLPLPHVYPLGIEGGFIAVLALDLLLIWVRQPIGWLRQFARVLAVAAVGLNAAAGWAEHGVLAAAMHALPPAILIACVEAIRTHLLRLVAAADEFRREPIPRMRWLLAPCSTAVLWRRMVLWQIARYPEALDRDLQRREALAVLRRAFGRRWKRRIPADVAYRLKVGVDQDRAIERAHALAAENGHGADTEGRGGAVPRDGEPITPATAQEMDIAYLNERALQALNEFLAESGGDHPGGGVAELPPGGAHPPREASAAERFPDHFGERSAEHGPERPHGGGTGRPQDDSGERSGERPRRRPRKRSGERSRKATGERNRERVSAYLAKHPAATNPQIARALKLGESTVRRIRGELNTPADPPNDLED